MQHYFGVAAIAQRLGCTKSTLYRWYRDRALPMFPRRYHGRRVQYASEAMLTAWELAYAHSRHPSRHEHSARSVRDGRGVTAPARFGRP